jgi:hypothetical protein
MLREWLPSRQGRSRVTLYVHIGRPFTIAASHVVGLVEKDRPSFRASLGRSLPAHFTSQCLVPLGLPSLKDPSRLCRCYATSTGSQISLKRACRCSESCRLHHIAPSRPYLNCLCPISFPFKRRSHFALAACSFPSSGTSTSPRLAMRYWLSTAQLVRPSHSTHLGHGADDISIR